MTLSPLMITNGYDTINDPCFQAAHQFPCYGQTMTAQQTPSAAVDTTNDLPPANGQTQVAFQGNGTEKKKSGSGWAIGGLILTAGAAALCFAAHRKGVGDTMTKKILNGLGQYLQAGKNLVLNFIHKSPKP